MNPSRREVGLTSTRYSLFPGNQTYLFCSLSRLLVFHRATYGLPFVPRMLLFNQFLLAYSVFMARCTYSFYTPYLLLHARLTILFFAAFMCFPLFLQTINYMRMMLSYASVPKFTFKKKKKSHLAFRHALFFTVLNKTTFSYFTSFFLFASVFLMRNKSIFLPSCFLFFFPLLFYLIGARHPISYHLISAIISVSFTSKKRHCQLPLIFPLFFLQYSGA